MKVRFPCHVIDDSDAMLGIGGIYCSGYITISVMPFGKVAALCSWILASSPFSNLNVALHV